MNRNIFIWPIVLYVALQLISNISSLKIGIVAGYAVDMGIFLFPLTFTIRDLMHQGAGEKISVKVIIYTALCNLALSLYLAFIGIFPASDSSEQSVFFDTVMGPIWRLVIASIAAQVVSELIDTYIYKKYQNKFKGKHKWGRVLASNTISIPVDNTIFCLGAFAFLLPWGIVWEIFVFNFIVKNVISLFSIPMIYIIKKDNK